MNRADYVRQVVEVTDYIYDHLDSELDLFRLAEVAHLSPFHWHRVYQAMCGESAAVTVRRLRLHRAAGYLAATGMSVREVAARSGFGSAEAFSRSFRGAYGMPPASYRESGQHADFRVAGPDPTLGPHPVELRSVGERVVAASMHTGSFMDIGRAFARARHGLTSAGIETGALVAVYYDDPEAVPEQQLRSAAGIEIGTGDVTVPDGLERMTLPAGEYAVLTYRGPYASMHAAYSWLYGQWLPASGRAPGDHPVVEAYLNDPVDTPPHELVTEILLLLEPLGAEPLGRSAS